MLGNGRFGRHDGRLSCNAGSCCCCCCCSHSCLALGPGIPPIPQSVAGGGGAKVRLKRVGGGGKWPFPPGHVGSGMKSLTLTEGTLAIVCPVGFYVFLPLVLICAS